MRPRIRPAVFSLALAASLWLGAGASAPAAWAEEQVIVNLELSTLAPASIVETLQARASDDWLSSLFPQFSPEDRERIRMMAIEPTPRGVRVRIDLKEDVKDPERFRVAVEAALEQLAQNLPRPYSYSLKETEPPRKPARLPIAWLAAAGGLGLALLLLARRRPAFLSQPRFAGLPMAGILPAGLGMGGKFLELQSAPCQTMGIMVRELALADSAQTVGPAQRPVRQLAIAATSDPASAAVVTAALGISLVRDGKRVLVVDFLGEDSVLSEVLEESDDADSPVETGDLATLRHTGIPDLDLMAAYALPEAEDPDMQLVPRALTENYDWTLLVLPAGRFVRETPTFPVFSGPTGKLSAWRMRLDAWRQKAVLRGAILVGVPVPDEVRERMLARSYFERIRSLEKVIP